MFLKFPPRVCCDQSLLCAVYPLLSLNLSLSFLSLCSTQEIGTIQLHCNYQYSLLIEADASGVESQMRVSDDMIDGVHDDEEDADEVETVVVMLDDCMV